MNHSVSNPDISNFSSQTLCHELFVNPISIWKLVSPSSFPKESAHAGVTPSVGASFSKNFAGERAEKELFITYSTINY